MTDHERDESRQTRTGLLQFTRGRLNTRQHVTHTQQPQVFARRPIFNWLITRVQRR